MRADIIGLIWLGAAICIAQEVWHDPSPHKVSFVTVDNNVKLEVLDWGGSGRPVVLLAGYLTAHAYDDFAPKLSKFCRIRSSQVGLAHSPATREHYHRLLLADSVQVREQNGPGLETGPLSRNVTHDHLVRRCARRGLRSMRLPGTSRRLIYGCRIHGQALTGGSCTLPS